MLVEFRVQNYRSVAEEVCLSMVASRGSELPGNTFEVPEIRQRLLRSVVILGANGSGKSTVLAALRLLHLLVSHSATRLEPDDEIPVVPFLLDSTLTDQPTRFQISFVANSAEPSKSGSANRSLYRYTLAVTRHRVVEELLEAWPKGRLQVWYHRRDDQPNEFLGKKLQGDKRQIERLTRTNATYLSTAAQHNHPQLTLVYQWFQRHLRFITPMPEGSHGLLAKRPVLDALQAAPFTTLRTGLDADFQAQVAQVLRLADVGIDGLHITRTNLQAKVPPEVFARMQELGVATGDFFEVHTDHLRRDDSACIQWSLAQESDGTKRLFELVGPWLDVLENNFVLGVDEPFGALHPAITHRLLNLLHQAKDSTAQVILTSHDVSLLDQGLLRRDQVWFTEKAKGATELFSLDDFDDKPRKGETQLVQKYLLGKFGGVPLGGPFVLGPRAPRPATGPQETSDAA